MTLNRSIPYSGADAAYLHLDNHEDLRGLLAQFLESELSNHFTLIVPPHEGPLGIRIQLVPAGTTKELVAVQLSLLCESFRDGILRHWNSGNRVTWLPAARSAA